MLETDYTLALLGDFNSDGKIMTMVTGGQAVKSTHGSLLVRRRRGHPGVVLPLAVSISAKPLEGMQL